MDLHAAEFKDIVETLRHSAACLREADVRYCLSGSVASWARGGPETVNDLDLIVDPPDMEKAVDALVALGWKREDPPEGWLVKVWNGDVLVDLIHTVTGYESVEEILQRAAKGGLGKPRPAPGYWREVEKQVQAKREAD